MLIFCDIGLLLLRKKCSLIRDIIIHIRDNVEKKSVVPNIYLNTKRELKDEF